MHHHARERGESRVLYGLVRALLALPMRAWFHMRVSGAEHIPAHGGAIVAPNHKSFLDAFLIGISTRRHVRFMAKTELMVGPLGWLFVRLGAFPVRRRGADAEALETARSILEHDGLLVMFPEGTRVEDPHALGSPHHGAGRLALQTGAPIIPTAIAGTYKLWLGPIPKPRRVQVTFAAPIEPQQLAGRPGAVDEIIDRRVWPSVEAEYRRQLARPGLILAGLAATGIGTGLLARRRSRSTVRVLGVIEPGKVRRRNARLRRKQRVTRPLRRVHEVRHR